MPYELVAAKLIWDIGVVLSFLLLTYVFTVYAKLGKDRLLLTLLGAVWFFTLSGILTVYRGSDRYSPPPPKILCVVQGLFFTYFVNLGVLLSSVFSLSIWLMVVRRARVGLSKLESFKYILAACFIFPMIPTIVVGIYNEYIVQQGCFCFITYPTWLIAVGLSAPIMSTGLPGFIFGIHSAIHLLLYKTLTSKTDSSSAKSKPNSLKTQNSMTESTSSMSQPNASQGARPPRRKRTKRDKMSARTAYRFLLFVVTLVVVIAASSISRLTAALAYERSLAATITSSNTTTSSNSSESTTSSNSSESTNTTSGEITIIISAINSANTTEYKNPDPLIGEFGIAILGIYAFIVFGTTPEVLKFGRNIFLTLFNRKPSDSPSASQKQDGMTSQSETDGESEPASKPTLKSITQNKSMDNVAMRVLNPGNQPVLYSRPESMASGPAKPLESITDSIVDDYAPSSEKNSSPV